VPTRVSNAKADLLMRVGRGRYACVPHAEKDDPDSNLVIYFNMCWLDSTEPLAFFVEAVHGTHVIAS
jgi:hypothetical protein